MTCRFPVNPCELLLYRDVPPQCKDCLIVSAGKECINNF